MGIKRTPQFLVAITASSVAGILILAIWLLYETSLEQQRQRLIALVQSNARLIETIAAHFADEPGTQLENTLRQVRLSQGRFKGFGSSGELTLGQRRVDTIEFLLSHRRNKMIAPQPVSLEARLAEPMRRALLGLSGTMIGKDYSGNLVLAAYEPLSFSNWGLVAKIDMAEIRGPYLKATVITIVVAVLIIFMGSMTIFHLLNPLLQRLRDDNEYQRALFQNSPIGLVLSRLDGTLVDANPAFANIVGMTLDASRPINYRDITPGKYAAAEEEQRQRLKQHGEYGPYEKEFIHGEGYRVPVRLSGKLIKRRGETYIWSSVEDISDKICAEKRQRQAAAIFDTTDEGIVITDENNRITMVNYAFSKITGYSEIESLGRSLKMLQSDKHDEGFYAQQHKQLELDGNWRGEQWNRRKDGSIFPVWQQIRIIHDSDGRVANYISIFSDISELKAIEQQLAHLAHHDELTGLPNRLYFKAQVEKALQQAKRHHHMMALLFIDLDGFKQINDSYGHDVGDQLLKELAQRLLSCVREEDTVARMGGDEFILILNRINGPEDASLVASHVVNTITRPVQLGQRTLYPTASVGISIYPDDAVSITGLQKAADHAMYQAKEQGKNTFTFFAQQV